jgi:hypothetical protein
MILSPIVMSPAAKLPEASRATMALAVLALSAVVAELLTLPAVEMVASLVSTMAADALMSALTIAPVAIDVALPTEVMSPVRLALVVTVVAVLALPFNVAVIVPAEKLPDPSRATMADKVFKFVAVVAELLTLPAVLIVASLVSTCPQK